MFSVSRVVLVLLLLLKISGSLGLYQRDSLKARQEWTDDAAVLPQLRLQTLVIPQDVCVRVRLSIRPLLSNESLKMVFNNSETGESHTLIIQRHNTVLWWISSAGDQFFQPYRTKLQMREVSGASHQAVWILRYDCFSAQSGSSVSVSVHIHGQTLISASHIVQHKVREDLVPEASITVDEQEKRFTVVMKTQPPIKISLCYNHSFSECVEINYYGQIDPLERPVLNLSFPYLVPCVCVQLWFTHTDARRITLCPLKEKILPRGGDVLSSSSAGLVHSVLHWNPRCPCNQSDPSVSLCWRINTQDSLCVPAPNGTLHGTKLKYDVSAVDKHPQMCVKFSLSGNQKIFCPFESEGRSEWSVTFIPGSLRLHLRLNAGADACFAAQLCHRDRDVCKSTGPVVSHPLAGGAVESEMSVSFPFLSSGLCVQVWRVDLQGRRIICPDLTHRRWGLVSGSALALLAALTLLLCITCYLLKKSTSGWWSAERRPVLLVCSSGEAAHVTAVCSLASGLQGELRMDVRLAQWAQCCPQSSLAQLGPVPWLYGQCQSVQKAGGLVLIAWSPDAHQAYLRWRKSERGAGSELCRTRLYSAAEEDEQMCCEEECMEKPVESSSITAPVFSAALTCMWTGIHTHGHGRGFGLICFQSLDNNNCMHIPKPLQRVPKYCLTKDLSTLIHDLTASQDVPGGAHLRGWCWPRLLSKALSFSASRRLALRLEARLEFPKLPQKLVSSTKPWRKKRRRSKVSVCSCQKRCPETHPAADTPLKS